MHRHRRVTGLFSGRCMKKHISLTGYGAGRSTTVDSLTSNLIELLSAMKLDGRTLIALAKFSDYRYVQFYVSSEGDVIGEMISNLNIGPTTALLPEAEDALRALNFNEPAPGPNPNWWLHAAPDEEIITLVTTMRRAIYDVLGELPGNEATVSTWEAGNHGQWSGNDARGFLRVYAKKAEGGTQ